MSGVPSLVAAVALIDQLAACGLTDVVVAPGSRSAPLALAADAHPAITVQVRFDERSAAFCALGLARATHRPAAVVTTSGTAVAHLHAAVLEAHHAGAALIALTADRPAELRGVGANQTIDQERIFGSVTRLDVLLEAPDGTAGEEGTWREAANRAWAAAAGVDGRPGPVHLDVSFRDPLVGAVPARGDRLEPPQVQRAPSIDHAAAAHLADLAGAPGVLCLGDGALGLPGSPPHHGLRPAVAAAAFAEAAGWPVVAEPTAGAAAANPLLAPDHVLGAEGFLDGHTPAVVVTAGRLTLSRRVLALLRRAGRHVHLQTPGQRVDPAGTVHEVLPGDAEGLLAAAAARRSGLPSHTAWLVAWTAAGARARAALDEVLDAEVSPSEPRIARDLVASLPASSTLVVASSRPIRDVFAHGAPRRDLTIHANRGVAGIDGFVSTAVGIALGQPGPTTALAGDLSLLHDANGLAIGPMEAHPDLVIVVVSNDGGGIFSTIEAGGLPASTLERLFATPHGVDIAALASATGTGHRCVRSAADLVGAVEDARAEGGVQLVEVPTVRAETTALLARLDAAAVAAADST